jgi:hypothetical protein
MEVRREPRNRVIGLRLTDTEHNTIVGLATRACIENHQMIRRMLHFASRHMPWDYLPNDTERVTERSPDDPTSIIQGLADKP